VFLRILRRAALVWSSEMRMAVDLPRMPLERFYYSNPFDDDFCEYLQEYDHARDVLFDLASDLKDHDQSQSTLLNMIVLSAVLHGGIFSCLSIAALLRAVADMHERTMIANGRLHVELQLSWLGFDKSELRRWQPDALTAMLWARLSPDAAQEYVAPVVRNERETPVSDAVVYARFKRQFKVACCTGKSRRGFSLNSIVQASSVVAYTLLPPIIVRYASREIVSHSLTAESFRRFHRVKASSGIRNERIAAQDFSHSNQYARCYRSDDPLWLQSLLASIESSAAQQELESSRQSSTESLVKLFADFALWLRSVSAPSGEKYSTKSVVQIVGVLGRYLAPFLEDVDPVTADGESMSELYFQAMEATGPISINQKRKGALSRALSTFDRYLAGMRPSYSKSRFPWFPSGLANVDANPISHDDYESLLNNIDRNWPVGDAETRTIAWLLVVLGFRCGLRKMEALYLQVQDVMVLGRGELILRPTALRSLKSDNAERRIPLGIFLSAEEMDRLRAWKQQRLTHPEIQPTDCLFGVSAGNGRPVSEKVFQRIHSFMRSEKDSSTDKEHFHELRHGFATWMFLALMLSDLPEAPVLFPNLPKTTAWLSKCKELRTALFRHKYSLRKYAFMLARLLGHASPGTSLENYVHCADLLLAVFLDQAEMMRP